MTLHRVVIERIPKDRQKAAMPNATFDERVESQTPVSCWLEIRIAMELKAWLADNYPVMIDDDLSTILVYSLQQCDWPDHEPPPPPADFDLAAVGRAHASYKTFALPTGPSFGERDWTIIGDALKVAGTKDAARLLRSVRGHVANLRRKDEQFAAARESGG